MIWQIIKDGWIVSILIYSVLYIALILYFLICIWLKKKRLKKLKELLLNDTKKELYFSVRKNKRKKYIHKIIDIGIFRLSIYIMGGKKFCLRFECSWGWD